MRSGRSRRLTIEERDKLLPGALRTEGEGDGGEPVNGVQAEQDIIVLQAKVSRERVAGGCREASVTALPSARQ